MPVTTRMSTVHAVPEPAPMMIPGQWEPGGLKRFAASPTALGSMVDMTLNAATIADRQREGGGAPRERHPVRISRWKALLEALGARWRVRETPPPVPAVPKAVPLAD